MIFNGLSFRYYENIITHEMKSLLVLKTVYNIFMLKN